MQQTATIDRNMGVAASRSFAVTRAADRNGGGMPKERLRDILRRRSVPNTGNREVDAYRLRNLPNVLRGLPSIYIAKRVGAPTFFGVVDATVLARPGFVGAHARAKSREALDLGVISCRVVTDTGVGFIVDAWQNIVELEIMKYHGFGVGTTAEAAGQTALVTELTTEYATDNTRPTGSLTEGASGNIFRTVGTLSPDAPVAITEHAPFSQAANSGGVMFDRSKFSAINLVSGDSLQITYDATFTSGS